MTPEEPSLRQVRDEILTHVDLDGRVRRVEVQQAMTETALGSLKDEVRGQRQEMRDTKGEIIAAIEANKPKPVWPAVSSIVAVVALILVVAQSIYGA
jgi:hypothetical protein